MHTVVPVNLGLSGLWVTSNFYLLLYSLPLPAMLLSVTLSKLRHLITHNYIYEICNNIINDSLLKKYVTTCKP